jgi:hypothetical protein
MPVGVGHILGNARTCADRPLKQCAPRSAFRFTNVSLLSLHSLARGVCHNPAPVPLVGSANVVRSHNSPASIIPHFGKITEDHGKSSLNKQWAVFHEDEARSNFTDNARHFGPQS